MATLNARPSTHEIIEGLQGLRRFAGSPTEFWPRFLEGAANLCLAQATHVLILQDESGTFQLSTSWPFPLAPDGELEAFLQRASAPARTACTAGHAVDLAPPKKPHEGALLATRLEMGQGQPTAVLILQVAAADQDELEPSIALMKLLADVPGAYQKERALNQASGDVVRFAEGLDLMVLLNADRRYIKAAMTLCNEVATRYQCGRVSLGWKDGDYVKLQATSHTEHFEEKTSAVQAIEGCMEESVDQDEEVLWPQVPGSSSVTRAHEEYTTRYASGHMLTLPMRLDGVVVAALTCERAPAAFSESDVAGLRLFCDLAVRRLGDLWRTDRWFGARFARWVREKLEWFFGPEQTLVKAFGVLMTGVMIWVIFGTWDFRIDSTFLLRTDDLCYLPAPFEGYIEDVRVQVGDPVKKGDMLLLLDTRELLLDESSSVADISRQKHEAEKALARNALADMKIAKALEAQGQARLDKVRYRLAAAQVRAPMDGIVVEGDLKKMLGSPVRKGDLLFKVARVEKMYAELDVDERDVHEIAVGRGGEAAFVGRPNLSYPLMVERIDPLATTHDGRNQFTVRARLTCPPEPWWRPGMSGVAKLDVGRRTILWIVTHRTVEFLRLYFWY